MKAKLLVLTLLAGTAAFARTHFAFGFGFGYPVVAPPVVAYAPPPVVAYAPAPVYPVYPAANYAWIGGYYYPVGARWVWRPLAPVSAQFSACGSAGNFRPSGSSM